MEPIEAYTDTANRAKRLLRLHDGLINNRSRSIRSDWKESFCRLMHWPISSDIQRVDSADAVIVLRESANLDIDDFTKDSLDDLLRSSITFGISALDRYVHETIIKNYVHAYNNYDHTKQMREFKIPATVAIEIVNKVHKAKNDGKSIRPANEIRKAVQEILHKRPFQSWREIDYGYSLIGYSSIDKYLRDDAGLSQQDVDNKKKELNRIVARRNHIVHEGDLARHQRGGQIKPQILRRKWVEDSLAFIDNFVDDLEKI